MARLSTVLRAMPAILLGAALLAPFWDKPYTIDDPFFLEQARQVLADPLHPNDFEFTWVGETWSVAEIAVSGPGMAYLLAPVVRAGAPEPLAHLLGFALLALAAVALCSLSARLGATPEETTGAALLLVSRPAVLVMSGTVMPDVPGMALGLWGVERCAAFRERGHWWQGLAGAV